MTKFMINNRTEAWKTDVNLLTWSCKMIFWRPCKVIQFSWCTIMPESWYDLALFLSRFCKVHVPKILSRSFEDFRLNFWKKNLILDVTKILSWSWLCMVKILQTSICSRCMQDWIFSMFAVILTRSCQGLASVNCQDLANINFLKSHQDLVMILPRFHTQLLKTNDAGL